MEEINTTSTPEQAVPSTEENYIEQIKTLRANSVDRAKYDKVIAENKQLTEALVNGNSVSLETEETESIEDLAKSLLHDNLNNLDFITKSLQYRQQVLEKTNGQVDVFLAADPTSAPTTDQIAAAKRTAEAFQSCVDIADGNPAVFQAELQRVLLDNNLLASTRK